MTTPESIQPTAAHAALASAQTLLEQVSADLTRIDAFLTWLPEAMARATELEEYYGGPGQDDIAAVLRDDPQAVTPPVASEDAAWDALAELHDDMLLALRLVTARLTAELDQPRDQCGLA